MYAERPLLKSNAKTIVKTAKPSLITAGLIFIAVSLLLNTLSSMVLGVNISYDDAQRYMHYYMNGNFEAIMRMSEQMMPPNSAYLLTSVINIVLYIFTAGFIIFILNTVKNLGAVYGNLLDGFGLTLKLLALYLLEGLFVFLWSLLLVIPGLIAAYRYRMARYLLLDNPQLGAMESLRLSKQMMKGHKWELFVLDLSFIGWRLLSGIPYIGYAVMIWTTPYIETTYVLYYMALAGKPVIVTPAPTQPPYNM